MKLHNHDRVELARFVKDAINVMGVAAKNYHGFDEILAEVSGNDIVVVCRKISSSTVHDMVLQMREPEKGGK